WMLCALPAVLSYVQRPDAFSGRLNTTSVIAAVRATGSLWPAWDSLWRTLAVFHYQQGPIYHWFGIGTDPGVNIVIACLVLHGVVRSVSRWYTPRHALLLGWFLIGIVPGLLSSEAPRGYRILIAAPVVFVWAALPLARVISVVSAREVWRLTRMI